MEGVKKKKVEEKPELFRIHLILRLSFMYSFVCKQQRLPIILYILHFVRYAMYSSLRIKLI